MRKEKAAGKTFDRKEFPTPFLYQDFTSTPASSWSQQLRDQGSDPWGRSVCSSEWCGNGRRSCCYRERPCARRCAHHENRPASDRTGAGWRGPSTPRCSTNMRGRRSSSRRKEYIRKDRRASCGPRDFDGTQDPVG